MKNTTPDQLVLHAKGLVEKATDMATVLVGGASLFCTIYAGLWVVVAIIAVWG